MLAGSPDEAVAHFHFLFFFRKQEHLEISIPGDSQTESSLPSRPGELPLHSFLQKNHLYDEWMNGWISCKKQLGMGTP
jgi:hypothetical protein